MKRVLGLIVFSLFSISFAQNEPPALHVKQILLVENVIVAAGMDIHKVEIGDTLLATFADGSQCSMSVKSKSDLYLTLSLADCPKKQELKVLQSLETSLYQPRTKQSQEDVLTTALPLVDSKQTIKLASNELQSVSNFTPEGVLDISVNTTVLNTKTVIKGLVDSKSNSNDIDGTLRYGVNAWLNMGLKASYLVTRSNESVGSNSENAKGIKDPTFLVTIQLLKQGEGRPFNLIVNTGFSPKIIDEEHSNAGKGYSSNRTTAVLSHFTSNAEVGALFLYDYSFAGEGKFASGSKWESIANDGFLIGGYGQLQTSDFIYIYGGVGFGRASESQQKWNNETTGDWILHINSYDYTLLKVGSKFIIIPEQSFLSIDFETQKVHNGSGWIKNNATRIDGGIDTLEASAFILSWTYRL